MNYQDSDDDRVIDTKFDHSFCNTKERPYCILTGSRFKNQISEGNQLLQDLDKELKSFNGALN